MKNLLKEAMSVHDELAAGYSDESNTASPLNIWNRSIEKLTILKKE